MGIAESEVRTPGRADTVPFEPGSQTVDEVEGGVDEALAGNIEAADTCVELMLSCDNGSTVFDIDFVISRVPVCPFIMDRNPKKAFCASIGRV